ncbi:MAG: response regulator [Alphaproteobacteria bacterium]|nr:response regulator [Alphaproteobacteria bacterium]
MKFCLIVDDSDVIRKVAHKIIESAGFIALEAPSAEEALELCRKSIPDMILLDWQLPGMSAMDFLCELHQLPASQFPQILYAVTEADPQDLSRAYRAGIRNHILKPFSRLNLEPAIAELAKSVEVYA